MAKCSRCKRHVWFRPLKDGMCHDCFMSASQIRRDEMRLADIRRDTENARIEAERVTALAQDAAALLSAETEKAKDEAFRIVSAQKAELEEQIVTLSSALSEKHESLSDLEKRAERAETRLKTAQNKTAREAAIFRSIQYAVEQFNDWQYHGEALRADEDFDPSSFKPTIPADLACFQIKELRSMYRKNEKDIQALLESYKGRYTTKSNATIYQLMVLAMEAELQNILSTIGYGKLDQSLDRVRQLTVRYYSIASQGSQTIVSTLTKFIGQLEYYYLEAVKIEYEYYVKRERAKEEQRALKEQMRQEAEERKLLEQQKKQIEAEESKYEKELQRITEKMQAANDAELEKLRMQLEKVQFQLNSVQDKKDEIVRLQNGKAGTVYVISNIGSFGEDVFKVGMTRRLEPMDRVKELGDASVPFPFDVHSFIFSEDAVSLETKLHHELHNKRVNKINLRKEFFRVSLDELQALVEECDPSAAFNRTALAEQFRQSLSIDEIPENVSAEDFEEEE